MVLDGDVTLGYGDEIIHLATGDSVYIYAAIPHTFSPAGRSTARILSVSYGGTAEPAGRRPPPPSVDGRKPPATKAAGTRSRRTRG
jgi:uncharacterized cupin superfamily protein